jgi:hypothetical protein
LPKRAEGTIPGGPVKLPPLALTAPSLCPRCDAPALFVDECSSCALPIRQCGACLGVAGPFDRFCGFCGHELVLGRKRSSARRLWLLVALVPIVAGLAIGLSPIGQQAVRGGGARPAAATVKPTVTDRTIGFTASAPRGWQHLDSGGAAYLLSDATDQPVAAGSAASLLTATPKGAVVEVARPQVSDPGVDGTDPVGVLAFETAQLLGAPPTGYSISSVQSVRAVNLGGRVAARTELSLVGPGSASYVLVKVYVSAPSGGLVLIEALTPATELPAVNALIDSVRLSR